MLRLGIGRPKMPRMMLRCWLLLVGILVSFAATAQPPASQPRIGYLSLAAEDSPPQMVFRAAFLSGMRDLGYVGARAPLMSFKFAQGNPALLRDLATMLADAKLDVLVGEGQQASSALKAASSSVPVVMLACDAVTAGLVPQLARPGGNVTGITCLTPELTVKRVQLLRDLKPSLRLMGILWNSHDPNKIKEVQAAQAAAGKLGLSHKTYEVRTVEDIDAQFAAMRTDNIDSMLLIGDAFMIVHRQRIVAAVSAMGVPAMYPFLEFVDAGGLASYGPSLPAMFQAMSRHVDKILKGAKPGELPVEQPTIFDFAVNLPSARAAGIAVPISFLAQASKVID